jgi:hypothetical protein
MTRKKKTTKGNPARVSNQKPKKTPEPRHEEKSYALLTKRTEIDSQPNNYHDSPTMVMHVGDRGIFIDHSPVKKSKPTPVGDTTNGHLAEQEVLDFFAEVGVSKKNIFNPRLYTFEGESEIEVSDGIILYGDTAFLLQTKSRNVEKLSDFAKEKNKMSSLKNQASKQVQKSVTAIDRAGGITFTNLDGEEKLIKVKDYNWVGLILLSYNESPVHAGNRIFFENNSEIPRVIITVNELEKIRSTGSNPSQLLNYLRRMQYQPRHKVGGEISRYFEFVDSGIYPFYEPSLLIELDKAVHIAFERKNLSAKHAKEVLYPIDFMQLGPLSDLQDAFYNHLRQKSHNKKMFWGVEKAGYVIYFYDSSKQKFGNINLIELSQGLVGETVSRLSPKADFAISLVIDVNQPLESMNYSFSSIGGSFPK